MASKMVTMKTSAMSSNVKFATLTQQCFKRIHNTCDEIPFNEKVNLLNDFMHELYISGYNEKERFDVLQGGINTHEKIMVKVTQGLRPFYRPNGFNKIYRKCEKELKKNNWFKNHISEIQYGAVMFVDATPNDRLLKLFKHIENTHKINDMNRIKFVSKSGTKLSHIVSKKDPFQTNCGDKNCKPSNDAESEGKLSNCKRSNVSYMAQCKPCKEKGTNKVYFGETARNLHIRSAEHYKDCDNKNKTNSWMRKHIESVHGNNRSECDFEWKVINSFRKPMQRQLSEAVHIHNTKTNELLNLKNEYFSNNIRALELPNSENNITCNSCGHKFDKQNQFKEHFTANHKRYKCSDCDYVSFGDRDLKSHKDIHHNKS